MNKARVVLDSNVLLSGLKSDLGNSYKVLQALGSGLFEIALSVPLVLEYESILKKYLDRAIYSDQRIEEILDSICSIGIETKVFFLWRPILSDGFDDHILEVAVAGQCDSIVTFNKRHFVPARKFGLKILEPKEFIDQIRRSV
jgi:putative PIN family toxin of toxin-antitoxin system